MHRYIVTFGMPLLVVAKDEDEAAEKASEQVRAMGLDLDCLYSELVERDVEEMDA